MTEERITKKPQITFIFKGMKQKLQIWVNDS